MATPVGQDMPPPGGYRSITWERVPLKPYMKARTLFGGYAVITSVFAYLFYLQFKMLKREELEINDAKLAVHPLIYAERDREYLKQIRRNRADEAELMKNVPGWMVGGFNGKPIYRTIGNNEWVDPDIYEYYAHVDYKTQRKRQTLAFTQ